MSEVSSGSNENNGIDAAKSYRFSGIERAENVESAILNAVRGIRYGSVEITIHDSRVVLIESKKKIRIQA